MYINPVKILEKCFSWQIFMSVLETVFERNRCLKAWVLSNVLRGLRCHRRYALITCKRGVAATGVCRSELMTADAAAFENGNFSLFFHTTTHA